MERIAFNLEQVVVETFARDVRGEWHGPDRSVDDVVLTSVDVHDRYGRHDVHIHSFGKGEEIDETYREAVVRAADEASIYLIEDDDGKVWVP
jgi:hypothetical protein